MRASARRVVALREAVPHPPRRFVREPEAVGAVRVAFARTRRIFLIHVLAVTSPVVWLTAVAPQVMPPGLRVAVLVYWPIAALLALGARMRERWLEARRARTSRVR